MSVVAFNNDNLLNEHLRKHAVIYSMSKLHLQK